MKKLLVSITIIILLLGQSISADQACCDQKCPGWEQQAVSDCGALLCNGCAANAECNSDLPLAEYQSCLAMQPNQQWQP